MVTFTPSTQSFEGKQQGLQPNLVHRLYDDINRFHFPSLQGIKEIFKADAVGCLTLFHQARLARSSPAARADFSSSQTAEVVTRHWRFVQTSDRNRVDGPATFTTSRSLVMARTRPKYYHQRWVLDIQSTLLNRRVATAPLPLSKRASITVPMARTVGSALSSWFQPQEGPFQVHRYFG